MYFFRRVAWAPLTMGPFVPTLQHHSAFAENDIMLVIKVESSKENYYSQILINVLIDNKLETK